MCDLHWVTKVQGVYIPDKHVQKDIEAKGGKGTALFTSRVDGDGISQACKRSGYAGKAGLESVNEGNALGIEAESLECIQETLIGGRVIGF